MKRHDKFWVTLQRPGLILYSQSQSERYRVNDLQDEYVTGGSENVGRP